MVVKRARAAHAQRIAPYSDIRSDMREVARAAVHALQRAAPLGSLAGAEAARVARRCAAPHPSRAAASVSVSRSHPRVLVLAREAVLGALVGLLLEPEDYEPVFAAPDERPAETIRRLRPPLLVVLDGQLPEAQSDLFFARCAQDGASVCLFSEPVAADEVRAGARLRRLAFFAMPVDRRELGAAMALARGERCG
ncbi:MAG: hypothetical protein ACXWZS_05475 [Gemmatirosa sp.]